MMSREQLQKHLAEFRERAAKRKARDKEHAAKQQYKEVAQLLKLIRESQPFWD
jgi:hypothetical protein